MGTPTKDQDFDRIVATLDRFFERLLIRDREVLDREHKLREKAIEVLEKALDKSSGDSFYQMMSVAVKEASAGLSKVIDLKKLEVMGVKVVPAQVPPARAPKASPKRR